MTSSRASYLSSFPGHYHYIDTAPAADYARLPAVNPVLRDATDTVKKIERRQRRLVDPEHEQNPSRTNSLIIPRIRETSIIHLEQRSTTTTRPDHDQILSFDFSRSFVETDPPTQRNSSVVPPPSHRDQTKTFLTSLFPPTPGSSTPKTSFRHRNLFRRTARKVAHSVHLIRFLARILKNPIEWSWEYDPKTYDLSSPPNSETLPLQRPSSISDLGLGSIPSLVTHETFSVAHLFTKPRKFKGLLDHDMRELFRKKREKRTKGDIERMVEWCGSMKCMEKYPVAVQKAFMQAARYTRWHTSRQIVKEGHPAFSFYIILEGEVEMSRIDHSKVVAARDRSVALAGFLATRKSVFEQEHSRTVTSSRKGSVFGGGGGSRKASVFVGKEDEAINKAIAAHEAKLAELAARRSVGARGRKRERKREDGGIEREDGGDEGGEDEDEKKVLREIEEDLSKAYTIRLGYLTAGESFGDIEFITHSLRRCSYTTTRPTEFLAISQRDYEHIILNCKDSETVKQDMLQTLPIFRTLNADMATLLHCSMMRTVEANKVVVKQGEVGRNLFFIRSGTCRIVQAVQFVKQDLGYRMFRITPLSEFLNNVSFHPNTRSTIPSPTSSSLSLAFRTTKKPPTQQPIDIKSLLPPHSHIMTELLVTGKLGPGDHFGETPSTTSSIITNQKTTLLIIPKIDLQRLATDETWSELKSSSKNPDVKDVERAYLDDRGWKAFKRVVLEEIARTKKLKKKILEDSGRNPFAIEGDGFVAWSG